MKNYYEIIKQNPLFIGINFEAFELMLNCVQGRVEAYSKNDIILLAGNPVETVGLVLLGTVQVVREDSDGKQNLLTELNKGDIFGEVFACAGVLSSPVTVLATSPVEILHLNYRKVITTCSSSCQFHQQLISNMLALIAKKNLMLNQKIEILSKRTTKERLSLFLKQYSDGKSEFTIPYNHEELAAFLCVDRSAMSAELSKMQKAGKIKYTKQTFQIK